MRREDTPHGAGGIGGEKGGCPGAGHDLCGVYSTRIPKALPPLFPDFQWTGSGHAVHLTFDDGPHPEWTPFVLDQLGKRGHTGTFFCVGDNIDRHPDVFARIREEGHAWGNHTMHHDSGWTTPHASYLRSVLACEQRTESGLFRPPYGRMTLAQGRAIRARYRVVMWNVLTGDFDRRRTAEECLRATLPALRPGAIVVMHDSEKAAPRLQGLLPGVLDHLEALGLRSEALPMPGLGRVERPEDSHKGMGVATSRMG